MATCQNLISICSKAHATCPFVIYEGGCDHSHCSELRGVNFGEALDIYIKTTKPSRSSLEHINYAYSIIFKYTGFSRDTPLSAFDRATQLRVKELALKDYALNTVKQAFESIYRLDDDQVEDEYIRLGYSSPTIKHIRFTAEDVGAVVYPPDSKKLTWEQTRAIGIRINNLRDRALDDSLSRQCRLYAQRELVYWWLGLYFGLRPSDTASLTWEDNIKNIGGVMHLVFKAHKNKREIIEPFMKPNGLLIPKTGREKGRHSLCRYSAASGSMQRGVSRFFRQIGCRGWATYYMLRYYRAQILFATEGAHREAQALGHTVEIAQKHYYNKYDRTLKI